MPRRRPSQLRQQFTCRQPAWELAAVTAYFSLRPHGYGFLSSTCWVLISRIEVQLGYGRGTLAGYLATWHHMARCPRELIRAIDADGACYILGCCPWSVPDELRAQIEQLLRSLDKGKASHQIRALVREDDERILSAIGFAWHDEWWLRADVWQ